MLFSTTILEVTELTFYEHSIVGWLCSLAQMGGVISSKPSENTKY